MTCNIVDSCLCDKPLDSWGRWGKIGYEIQGDAGYTVDVTFIYKLPVKPLESALMNDCLNIAAVLFKLILWLSSHIFSPGTVCLSHFPHTNIVSLRSPFCGKLVTGDG